MAKAKAGAKKAKPAAKKAAAPAAKEGLLKRAGAGVAKAAAKVAKALQPEKAAKPAAKTAAKAAAGKPAAPAKPAAKAAVPKAAAAPKAEAPAPAAKTAAKAPKAAPARVAETAKAARTTPRPPTDERERAPAVKPAAPVVERPGERLKPRATKLPPVGEPLTRREMEQLLTAGQGRGVVGEGSLKGRLVLKDELPHLVVVGRDKRELTFLLQGPDQEVLPAYVDHKVSVSGLIRKTSNYGGVVDVRKYAAKKPEAEEAAPAAAEQKLRYLSPGEVTQVVAAGMGAGMKGFASIRGQLEMTGEEYILVVSNAGTRHQVSFLLEGKGTKGLRRQLGQTVQVTGVVDKTSGWGGRVEAETVEPRPAEFRPVSRQGMVVHQVEETPEGTAVELRLGEGLSVRLQEKAGFTWAIEPTAAKRAGLREVSFEPESGGPGWRELFFTPRNLGAVEIEFFLAKALTPGQVDRSWKLNLTVRP